MTQRDDPLREIYSAQLFGIATGTAAQLCSDDTILVKQPIGFGLGPEVTASVGIARNGIHCLTVPCAVHPVADSEAEDRTPITTLRILQLAEDRTPITTLHILQSAEDRTPITTLHIL